MQKGIIITVLVVLGIFILFILFKFRKKIFKAKGKKPKTKNVELKQEDKKESPVKDNKISFEKREVKTSKQENLNVQIQDVEFVDEQDLQYSSGEDFAPSRGFRRPFPQSDFQRNYFGSRKKSIREQIQDLSPEMKAILFTNAFGKKKD